jgi:hypothetical protein
MNLPPFEVAPFHIDTNEGSFDMLRVKCPRLSCKREFWVARIWGVITPIVGRTEDPPALVVGRPCPYCSRAAAIPEEFQINTWSGIQEETIQTVIKTKRRIVRRRNR